MLNYFVLLWVANYRLPHDPGFESDEIESGEGKEKTE